VLNLTEGKTSFDIFLSKRAVYTPENLGFCPPLMKWHDSQIERGSVNNVILARLLDCYFVVSNGQLLIASVKASLLK